MRPDKHKKKSHANYAKKSAQKSGQNEKVSNSNASCSGTGTEAGKRQRKRETDVNVGGTGRRTTTGSTAQPNNARDINNINISPVVNNDQSVPSFSRRKIESNWEKYDATYEEEQIVENRGADFSLLLSQTAGSQFRFKDEENLDDDIDNDEGEIASLLSFDCNELAEKLQSITLPERLDISRSLFDLELLELLDQDAATSSKTIDLSSGVNCHEEATSHTFKDRDESKSEHFDQDLENILSLTDPIEICESDNKRELDKSAVICDTAPMEVQLKENSDIVKRIECNEISILKPSEEQQQHLSKPSEDEDDLDFLLSLEPSAPDENESIDIQFSDEKQEPEVEFNYAKFSSALGIEDSGTSKIGLTTKLPVPSVTASDGLDDWLESMLDD